MTARIDRAGPPSLALLAAVTALAFCALHMVGLVDDWLREHGPARRAAVHAPRLSVPHILLQSDLVVLLSRRVSQAYARLGGFCSRELPCAPPRPGIGMFWHRRLDNQPAHRWLHELVQTVCSTL